MTLKDLTQIKPNAVLIISLATKKFQPRGHRKKSKVARHSELTVELVGDIVSTPDTKAMHQ
jgi:hypothetical protein